MSATNTAPPRADSLRTFKPNASQEKYVRDGLAYLNMTACFWSSLLYGELKLAYTADVPWAATDAHSVFMNPDGMKAEGWGFENICFVLAHEVCHYFLGDLVQAIAWREWQHVKLAGGQQLPYDHDIMNQAMDFRINAMLVDGKVGKMPSPDKLCYDPAISAKGEESCIEIYAKLLKQGKTSRKTLDQHFEPGTVDPNEVVKKAQAVAAAIQASEMAGQKVPDAIKRMVGDILEPKVSWADHLRASMNRAAGEPGLNWRQLNRRLISRPERIGFARQSRFGCGTIVFAADSSGSVTPEMFTRIMAEAKGIIADLNPAQFIALVCDTAVHNEVELEDVSDISEVLDAFERQGGVKGGGGTDFRPVFEWIKEHDVHPDQLVFVTDGYGVFPDEEPPYPVIWASISRFDRYPFGQVVRVEL